MGHADRSGFGRALSPLTISHPQVLAGAEDALREQGHHALCGVSCDYHDGVLTLRGRLPSYYLCQVARSAVASVAGVRRVVDRLEVVAGRCHAQPGWGR